MQETPDLRDSDIVLLSILARETNLSRFFTMAANAAAKVVGADGAGLILPEGNGHRLKYRFFQGLPPQFVALSQHAFSRNTGVAGAALAQNHPLFIEDYPSSDLALPQFVESGLKASLSIPIHISDQIEAVLALSWFKPVLEPLSMRQLSLATLFADFIGTALYRDKIENHLNRLAHSDPLTGLPNRAGFYQLMDKTIIRAQTGDRNTALVIIDIDNFKTVNDTLGHEFGDRLLLEISNRLREVLSPEDHIARLGGDEIAILVESARNLKDLQDIIRRISQALYLKIGKDGEYVRISSSVGVCEIHPKESRNQNALMCAADSAMYQAKRAGGNCAVFAPSLLPVAPDI
ncbi:sensor domain-containing diguanylate cyclase [Halothiobacillus sp.]|uniref:sensor domain-containing diguanylate cyclase n=1 Tax=Halothiobacillus sp. TaxID=1891311 RepID=UPI002AD3EDFE|nr:sensor domain-containing diguanylate cyclase [Halothiobacillus sp.]